MRAMPRLVLAAAVVGVLAACGGSEAGDTSRPFGPLSGRDVIEATKAEGTATFEIRDHGAVTDPGTDHGLHGEEEEMLDVDASFDFARNRSRLRWRFPAVLGTEPTDVEVRTVGATSYVKDGSWLCPGCGIDGEEPLPNDEWITFDETDGDVAFTFGSNALHSQLAWLALVEHPVEVGDVSPLPDGTEVGTYRAAIPVEDVNAAMGTADPDNKYALKYQGESIVVTFKVDAQRRLRELVVDYHVDDRARRLIARSKTFGAPVAIEVPQPEEIFDG
jgi:hypothetical protein